MSSFDVDVDVDIELRHRASTSSFDIELRHRASTSNLESRRRNSTSGLETRCRRRSSILEVEARPSTSKLGFRLSNLVYTERGFPPDLQMAETARPAASLPVVPVPPATDHPGALLGLREVPPERDLLDRARRGEPEAFRVIFDRHAPSVRRFLGDLLRDDAAADEATQETFVRAHSRMRTLREDERLGGWLLGIARMVSMEQLRRWRRDPLPLSDEEPREPDRAPSPEAALLSGEADRLLDGALRVLSAERRAALLMRIDHGLAYEQIAEAMGWKLQKVKNEIHRARLQLRERLAGYVEGGAS
jgi:RNA polymerase sigma-70 factor (ECF subfamily)